MNVVENKQEILKFMLLNTETSTSPIIVNIKVKGEGVLVSYIHQYKHELIYLWKNIDTTESIFIFKKHKYMKKYYNRIATTVRLPFST
jgi:hypothetical protein